ncbi:hypothetical protein GUJ93_ZPchr0012g19184 [Zizania palustris]|uniref:Uncharacterized protein n=1 Tax=Zizania palustris TaxID=103762 RepID=A0A8J6BSR1_ZIZPA|nr:hypothetical protein GUJ93_ZPchr0012g19184 [Zizania palustris]
MAARRSTRLRPPQCPRRNLRGRREVLEKDFSSSISWLLGGGYRKGDGRKARHRAVDDKSRGGLVALGGEEKADLK